jgi:hypothetical protein
LQVESNFVFIAQGGGNATLRILGIRLCDLTLGETEHAPGGREFDGGAETGDSRANNDKVEFGGVFHTPDCKWYHAVEEP